MTVFYFWQFPATGAPARRTLPDRLSDIVNVKDWNAKGDGSTDDTVAIQAAIDYCQSVKPNGAKGGTVFFPAGNYITGALAVGSNTIANAGVILLGSGFRSTVLSGPGGPISNGGRTFDNLERVEGLSVNSGIVLAGIGQSVFHCQSGIDASQALSASLTNISEQGGSTIYLGSHCALQDWRVNGGGGADASVNLSGYCPAVLSSSSEAGGGIATAIRVGWAPSFSLTPTSSTATTITFASFPNSGVVPGRGVSGTNIASGATILTVDKINHVITVSPNNTPPVTGPVTFGQECPAYGFSIIGFQTEAMYTSLDLYNAQGGLVSGFQMSVIGPPNAGAVFPGNTITAITWSAGTAHATVQAAHGLAIGVQTILQLYPPGGADPSFIPSYTVNQYVVATPTDSTHFNYDLPSSPTAGYTSGSLVFLVPCQYGLRCRKVYDTAIMGMGLAGPVAYASVDLDYNGQAQHRNNMLWSVGPMVAGIVLPSDRRNLAGWNFNESVSVADNSNQSLVNRLLGHAGWNGPITTSYPSGIGSGMVNNPEGNMTFSCLPGQTGVFQPGPYEGQEFFINDGQKSPPGTANPGDLVQGGGAQHIKVRYVAGSVNNWIRMA